MFYNMAGDEDALLFGRGRRAGKAKAAATRAGYAKAKKSAPAGNNRLGPAGGYTMPKKAKPGQGKPKKAKPGGAKKKK